MFDILVRQVCEKRFCCPSKLVKTIEKRFKNLGWIYRLHSFGEPTNWKTMVQSLTLNFGICTKLKWMWGRQLQGWHKWWFKHFLQRTIRCYLHHAINMAIAHKRFIIHLIHGVVGTDFTHGAIRYGVAKNGTTRIDLVMKMEMKKIPIKILDSK